MSAARNAAPLIFRGLTSDDRRPFLSLPVLHLSGAQRCFHNFLFDFPCSRDRPQEFFLPYRRICATSRRCCALHVSGAQCCCSIILAPRVTFSCLCSPPNIGVPLWRVAACPRFLFYFPRSRKRFCEPIRVALPRNFDLIFCRPANYVVSASGAPASDLCSAAPNFLFYFPRSRERPRKPFSTTLRPPQILSDFSWSRERRRRAAPPSNFQFDFSSSCGRRPQTFDSIVLVLATDVRAPSGLHASGAARHPKKLSIQFFEFPRPTSVRRRLCRPRCAPPTNF
ncbi:hypothetical protein B0H10DRAFT_193089 [Mycena sp. CBHHK59/15]|nr:hypothetical protein B0H10DRAFT_193089 [Mycena sp. CBHHK59/15]